MLSPSKLPNRSLRSAISSCAGFASTRRCTGCAKRVKRLPGSDQRVEGRKERYLLSRPSRFAERHSRHRLDIVALEGALARRLTMRRSRPTATLTCRRPPATEAHLCFATVIALSSSDIAPEKKVYWG